MKQRIGEWVDRIKRSRPGRAYARFGERRGNRLAGAVTFYSFVSLVPVLLLGVAVVSWSLGGEGIAKLQDLVDENLPGLEIDLDAVRDAAGALTLIGVPSLVLTGVGAVDALRAAVRSMWDLDDEPGSALRRKAVDVLALAGLGLIVPLSMLATAALAAGDALLDAAGLSGPVASVLSTLGAYAVAIVTSGVLVAYLLAGVPRISVPWRVLLPVAVVGGLVLELLKQGVARFIGGPAGSNVVAALAAPLAVLAWIYLVARVIMFLAAYTAEWSVDEGEHPASAHVPGTKVAAVGPREVPAAVGVGRPPGVAAATVAGVLGGWVALAAARGARAALNALRGG